MTRKTNETCRTTNNTVERSNQENMTGKEGKNLRTGQLTIIQSNRNKDMIRNEDKIRQEDEHNNIIRIRQEKNKIRQKYKTKRQRNDSIKNRKTNDVYQLNQKQTK